VFYLYADKILKYI